MNRIAKYFTHEELACRCGCGFLPTQVTLDRADSLRESWGRPLVPTSGARCPAHNESVNGDENSEHMDGVAIDFVVLPEDRFSFVSHAIAHGYTSIGVYKRFIHLGTRDKKLWPGAY